MNAVARHNYIMHGNSVPDVELWGLGPFKKALPLQNYPDNAQFPIIGAAVHKPAGYARHDAVASGYARSADNREVDIIENCEVTGIAYAGENATALETTRGMIPPGKLALAVVESTSRLWQYGGLVNRIAYNRICRTRDDDDSRYQQKYSLQSAARPSAFGLCRIRASQSCTA